MNWLLISAAGFEREKTEVLLKKKEQKFLARDCGVGALTAAKNAAELGRTSKGKDVIFIGSCGSLADFKTPYLITAKKIVWAPTAERDGKAYAVKGTNPAIAVTKKAKWVRALPERTVLCGPSISLIPAGLKSEDHENQVENLELYSCAAEIMDACHSFAIILCVTNALGSNAHAEWEKNFGKAAQMTSEFIEAALFN